jgi:uncharacterized protein Yka (UPF0111/DUF47 family)
MKVKHMLAQMLGFKPSSAPDPIRAQIIVASQRNERAAEEARHALQEMLDRRDNLSGPRK